MNDRVRLVHDGVSGVEAIHARFSGHAYDLHRHDEWLVGVTDDGVQDFFCRGYRRRSTPERVILIEPGEIHDGQAGGTGGFSYSMLYLPQAWMRNALDGSHGGVPGFHATLSDDPILAHAIRRACDAFGRPLERLARDDSLDGVLDALRPHIDRRLPEVEPKRDARVARRARDALHAAMAEQVGADALARPPGLQTASTSPVRSVLPMPPHPTPISCRSG